MKNSKDYLKKTVKDNNRPIVTVREARRLLGKDSKSLNDVEVMEVVNLLREMAKTYLSKKSVKKSNKDIRSNDGLSKPRPR